MPAGQISSGGGDHLISSGVTGQHRRAASNAGPSDRPEILGVEAGSADEGAIDLGEAEKRRGVFRVDRTAVEDACSEWDARTDLGVHRGDVVCGCGQSGSNRPHWFVGDYQDIRASSVRDRSGELRRTHLDRLPLLTLLARLADAQDRHQAGSPRAADLVANDRVRFAVAMTALRVPEDDMAAAQIGQHLGADVAGGGTLWGGMPTLTTQSTAAAGGKGADCGEQGRRRAYEKLAAKPATGRSRPLCELARQRRAIVAQ